MSAPQPCRLLIAGDTHGSASWITYLAEQALDNNCDAIIQLGDFGYFPHMLDGQDFLDQTVAELERTNLKLYFIDGNHENFDLLWNEDHAVTEQGFWRVWQSERLLYIPRGLRWSWSGVRFLGMGGAHSIDKHRRLAWENKANLHRLYWWPQERITEADVRRACLGQPVDVMFTHDVPAGVDVPSTKDFNRDRESFLNRCALQEIVEDAQPRYLFHGHLHFRYSMLAEFSDFAMRVEGLSLDNTGRNSWLVFDLTELEKENAA